MSDDFCPGILHQWHACEIDATARTYTQRCTGCRAARTLPLDDGMMEPQGGTGGWAVVVMREDEQGGYSIASAIGGVMLLHARRFARSDDAIDCAVDVGLRLIWGVSETKPSTSEADVPLDSLKESPS